jgi:hypothetical protein
MRPRHIENFVRVVTAWMSDAGSTEIHQNVLMHKNGSRNTLALQGRGGA